MRLLLKRAGGTPTWGRQFPHRYLSKEPDGRGGWRYKYATTTKLDPAPQPHEPRFREAARIMAQHHEGHAAWHELNAREHAAWYERAGGEGRSKAAEALHAAAATHRATAARWRDAGEAPREHAAGAMEAVNTSKRSSDRAEKHVAAERARYGRPALFG